MHFVAQGWRYAVRLTRSHQAVQSSSSRGAAYKNDCCTTFERISGDTLAIQWFQPQAEYLKQLHKDGPFENDSAPQSNLTSSAVNCA